MLVLDLLERGRAAGPDRPALVSEVTVRTWGELADRVARLASCLTASGVVPASRVALLSPNCPAFLEVVLACARLGACVVPLNLRLLPDEVRFQVADAGVGFAVVHPATDSLAGAGGLLELPHLVLDDALDALLAATEPFVGEPPSPDSVLVQLYTSGTTGRPKGCLLTQANWDAATRALVAGYALRPGQAVLTALPLFHVAGLHHALSALAAGGTAVLPESTEADVLWDLVEEHDVAVCAAPFTLGPALKSPRAATAGRNVRRVVSGPLRRLPLVLPDADRVGGFGATELCGYAFLIEGRDLEERPTSVGRPLPGYEAQVLDPATARPVPTGEVGELVVRGPAVTSGYWKLPDATAELTRGGWVHTGDLFRVDAEGWFCFVDRAKDMVKPGGENVYSIEVETVLTAHPAVAEAAVVGVPDARWGEAVKAVLVLHQPVEPAVLDAWCLERLAPYKRPRWYEIVTSLPKNATHKVLKGQLRAAHDDATSLRLQERS